LRDAYSDFILSHQARNHSPATLHFYKYTVGFFLAWCESKGLTEPPEVTARYIRQYIAELADRGLKDTTMHDHARAIRTLVRFWHAEGYIPNAIKFDMPKLEQKRLPVLTVEQLQQVIKACNIRDRALVMFLADSGLRRAETIALNWGDIDMTSGLVNVKRGKGGKARSAVIGARARRALLKYRRTLSDNGDSDAVFQIDEGGRFSGDGFIRIFTRLSKRTGIHVTAHALRRTFVIICLRGGMDLLHLKTLLGHADYTLLERYAQLEDIDLVQAHKKHSPIDSLRD